MSVQLDILEADASGGHPDEGAIQSWIDGEVSLVEARPIADHVAGCGPCEARARELRDLALRTTALLEGVGEEAMPRTRSELDAARWNVRRRRASQRGRGMTRRSAVAAAGLVLIATGVAVAIPGSPLRDLFTGGGTGPGGGTTASLEAPMDEATLGAVSPIPGMAGVAIAFRDARVEVILEGAAPGTVVELEGGAGDRVEVLAPDGTPVQAGAGSVTVDLTARPAGEIRIRIPPSPGEVLVRSGLRNLVRWRAGAFHFGEGIRAEPRSDGVRVEVPAS